MKDLTLGQVLDELTRIGLESHDNYCVVEWPTEPCRHQRADITKLEIMKVVIDLNK